MPLGNPAGYAQVGTGGSLGGPGNWRNQLQGPPAMGPGQTGGGLGQLGGQPGSLAVHQGRGGQQQQSQFQTLLEQLQQSQQDAQKKQMALAMMQQGAGGMGGMGQQGGQPQMPPPMQQGGPQNPGLQNLPGVAQQMANLQARPIHGGQERPGFNFGGMPPLAGAGGQGGGGGGGRGGGFSQNPNSLGFGRLPSVTRGGRTMADIGGGF